MLAVASALGAVTVLAFLAGVMAARRLIAIVTVTGQSMEPTLTAGDRVLVRRVRLQSVRAGQLVVVEAPSFPDGGWTGTPPRRDLVGNWIIKRAAAVPGDPLPSGLPATLAGDRIVPDGKLVVLGDNPDMSMDSRYLGYIPGDRLLGVVIGSLPRNSPASPARGSASAGQPTVYSYGSAAISTPETCPVGSTPEARPTGSSPPARASTYSVPRITEPARPDRQARPESSR